LLQLLEQRQSVPADILLGGEPEVLGSLESIIAVEGKAAVLAASNDVHGDGLDPLELLVCARLGNGCQTGFLAPFG
jgi:hypothetical protein